MKSWRNFINDVNCRTNINDVWNRLRKLIGKQTAQVILVMYSRQGNHKTQPQRVADVMAEYFTSLEQGNNNVVFNRRKIQTERQPLDLEGDYHYNTEITHAEFQCTISAMKEDSPGPDGISYRMTKQVHPTLQELIVQLYNKILSEKIFPEHLEIGHYYLDT